jgi:hypothetical protein
MLSARNTRGLQGRRSAVSNLHATGRPGSPRPRHRASRAARGTAAIFAALLVSLLAPVAGVGADKPKASPTPLWRAFPLRPEADRQAPRGDAAASFRTPRAPAAATPAPGDGGGDRTLLVLALAGGASILFLLALLAARPVPTTKGVFTMSSFIRRRTDGQSGGEPAEVTELPSRVDKAMTSYTMRSEGEVPPPEPVFDEEGSPAGARGIVSYDELGQTIANVLRSAQDNAAQVVSTARAQAQSIREAAEAQAKEARVQLEAELAERRAESERIRADANRYAEDRRRDADQEANQLRADAEVEARKLREAGEAIRRTLEEKGLARRQELMEASSSMEARLRDALETCRTVTGTIEELLDEPDLDEDLLNEVREAEEEPEAEEVARKAS